MSVARQSAIFACALTAVIGAATAAAAQSGGKPPAARLLDTRPVLVAAERAAESQHRTAEAAYIHARLQNGDFAENDRIAVLAYTPPTGGASGILPGPPLAIRPAPDTLFVLPGRVVVFPQLPGLPPLSLAGVLRSELTERVKQHFLRLYRDSNAVVVRAVSLVNIGVLGSVGRPTYYSVPPELKLSELIAAAGGYAGDANPDKIVVRRGTEKFLEAAETRAALTSGASIDFLQLRAGDEVVVGKKVPRNWLNYVQFVISMATLAFTLNRQ